MRVEPSGQHRAGQEVEDAVFAGCELSQAVGRQLEQRGIEAETIRTIAFGGREGRKWLKRVPIEQEADQRRESRLASDAGIAKDDRALEIE